MRAGSLVWVVCGAAITNAYSAMVHANGPAFVPGDLIVKFAATSEIGTQVLGAGRSDSAGGPELEKIAARLSRELGVAVTARSVTSGRELVLSVDRDRLTASLATAARRDAAVRRVEPVAAPKTVLPATRLELAVQMDPASEAGRLVQRALQAGTPTGPELDALARRFGAGVDPPPTGRAVERDRLIVVVDVAALTLELLDRLRRRPDVEYAQASHILRPAGGA